MTTLKPCDDKFLAQAKELVRDPWGSPVASDIVANIANVLRRSDAKYNAATEALREARDAIRFALNSENLNARGLERDKLRAALAGIEGLV